MKRIEIFTPEEIEKYGFIYEPDASKCKTGKISVIYSNSGKDEKTGLITHYPNIFESSGLSEKYIKDEISFHIFFTHIHSIFSIEYDDFSFGHAHNRVMFTGHTKRDKEPTEEEIIKFINRPI